MVDITSVDGCQGREKDVVIFSCVRASEDKSIGFLSDRRRMNVGITRARSSVLVVGSASTLRRDEHWKNLVESGQTRECLFKILKPYSKFFSDENMKSMTVKSGSANKESKEMGSEVSAYPISGEVDQVDADEN